MVIAKQANVTTGPQQANNGVASPSRARGNEIGQRKRLDASNGDRLDTRAAGAVGGGDQALATVGTVHGAQDTGGEGWSEQERLQGRNPAAAAGAGKTTPPIAVIPKSALDPLLPFVLVGAGSSARAWHIRAREPFGQIGKTRTL